MFAAIAVVALGAMQLLGPHYGDLQTAADLRDFKDILPDQQHGRYIAAALADLVFAAAYGLSALAFSGNRRLAMAGGVAVALGAIADQLENVFLLRNISGRESSIRTGDIDTMQRFGLAKSWLIGIGLVVLLAAYVWSRRAVFTSWLDLSKKWYTIYVAIVALMIPAAGRRWLPVIVVLLVALAFAGTKLNDVVRNDRKSCEADGTPDHGAARMMLAAAQLAVAAGLILLGKRYAGRGFDGLYFLGVALVVMSLGVFVSEFRQNVRLRPRGGPIMVLASLVMLVFATTIGGELSLALLVAGLVVGEMGTEILSEAYQRWDKAPPGWLIGGAGLVVLVAGLALLIGAGADPGHVVPLVAALTLIVFFASADGDALIIVFIVAVALVWATTPRGVELDPRTAPTREKPYFVAFGDSFISGEGAKTFIDGTNEKVNDQKSGSDHTNECRQARTAWPFRVAGAPAAVKGSAPDRVLFLGCSGAVSENIHTLPRVDPATGDQHGPAELALFERAQTDLGAPVFAVISIGGNDAGFGDIVTTCVAPGNCAEVGEQFLRGRTPADADQLADGPPPVGRPESLAHINDDLDAAYTRVKRALRGVPVIAVPYPVPVTASGRCSGVLLDQDERRFVAGFVRELNAVIRDAATRNDVLYMDTMEDALAARESQLCNKVAGGAGLNFLALSPTGGSIVDSLSPKNWTHNSLHPNADGHLAMAEAAQRWFALNTPLPTPRGMPNVRHQPAPIDALLRGAAVPQCDPSARRSCTVDGSIWLSEQLHSFLAKALFPLAIGVTGIWLILAPLLRWGRRRNEPLTVGWVMWPGLRHAGRRIWRTLRWLWQAP